MVLREDVRGPDVDITGPDAVSHFAASKLSHPTSPGNARSRANRSRPPTDSAP